MMTPRALPAQPTRLIGRAREVERIRGCLEEGEVRLLTLTGPPGIGKTRLAIAVATSLVDAFADGVFFVELSPVEDPRLVLPSLAQALGVREDANQSIDAALKCFLNDKHLLLVLDNFEQVAAAADEVAGLLAHAARLEVLVTSRTPLHLSWEHAFPVPPLDLPPLTRRASPERLKDYPSIALFVERAQAIDPNFRLDAQNARTVATICARLDGLPLAIELAAARSKLLNLGSILSWLAQEPGGSSLRLLSGGWRDQEPRHRTMRAAIDWSYRLLSPDEQTLFRRLAVFIGGFTLDAAALVCPSCDPLDLVGALVDQSLLVRIVPPVVSMEEPRETRLRMLQTIRGYALEQLDAAGELESMRRCHAAWFLALAEQADRESAGPTQRSWVARLQPEQDNLRAALSWSLDHEPETALRLAGHLSWFWYLHGPYAEAQTWLEATLARSPEARPEWRAKALSGAGTMAWHRGNFTQAIAFHQKSLALYRELGDRSGIAQTLNNLGAQALNLGDFDQARRHFEKSLAVARESGDASTPVMPLINLGLLALDQNQLDQARCLLEEGLKVCRQTQQPFLLIHALQNLGETLFNQGELDRALELHRESLRVARNLGARGTLAFCLEEVGGVYAARGEVSQAVHLFGASQSLRESHDAPVPPHFRAQFYDPTVATLRARLDGSAFASLWTEGRALSMDQAIAEALGEDTTTPGGGASHQMSSPTADPPSSAPEIGLLTKREREVAVLIARGLSNREIAEQLVIGESTAITHVAHILSKLSFHSRAQIAAWVVAKGLANTPAR